MRVTTGVTEDGSRLADKASSSDRDFKYPQGIKSAHQIEIGYHGPAHHTQTISPKRNRSRDWTYHRVINLWNNLLQNVVDAESVKYFKSRLNSHWNGDSVYEY